MEEIIKGNEYLLRVLPDMCAETPDAIIHKQDMDGNWQHWFTLATPAIVPQVAAVFKKEKARLSLISGYPIRNRKDDSDPLYGVCYHYVLDGVVYTPYVNLYADDPTVPTITPWYDNADWHEREMQELVGIKVRISPARLGSSSTLNSTEALSAR